MIPPADSDNQDKPATGNAQNITGKNVVGSVHAEGSAQVTVNQVSYNQLSEVEEERERQKAELDILQNAITQKYFDLNSLVGTPIPSVGNPYLFLQPFGLTDHSRFFGRDNEIAELYRRVTQAAITFLSGNSGMGKTSLLKAGLTPALLKQKHLPLIVNVNNESLEISIKKELLPNIDMMPFLKSISLTEFIRIVTSALPEGKMLFIFVDDFERFFNDKEHSELERNAFYNEWQRCFNGAALNTHWLFCTPFNLQYLLKFFKREAQTNPNTINVFPFDRISARVALLGPAKARGIKVDEEVVTSILDILGGNNIDPASLQLVCYMLAGGKGTPNNEWTMEYYISQGKADGILRDYLDRTIEELEPQEREPAWQVLAVLAGQSIETSTEEQLVEKLKLYDVEEKIIHRVLIDLEGSNLIERGAAFKLTSESLRPRIEKWKETRSARERAREEAIEQLSNIRSSALRGLLGGVIGFIAFDQIVFKGTLPDFSYIFFKLILDATIGAIAGLIMVFSVDMAVASYSGPKRWMAYLGGGLGGALAFSLAIVLYSNLVFLGPQTFLAILPRAILVGALWGTVSGMGTAWTLKTQRPYWITIPVFALSSGLSLMVADSILGVLTRRFIGISLLSLGIAGAILPAFIFAAAMVGRGKFHE